MIMLDVSRLLMLLGLVAGRAWSSPMRAQQARIITRDTALPEYDFIIAGAGTAGLTVGDRLSEDGKYSVLVIEYGYYDLSNAITATGGPPDVKNAGPEYYSWASRFYNLTSEPLPELDNRTMVVAAGAVVGGSSAVNGQFFDRGSAEDYDAWVWAAGPSHEDQFSGEWGWDKLLPWFKKSVTFYPPTPETAAEYEMTFDVEAAYGGSTPIDSSYPPFQWPAQKLVWDAWKTMPDVSFPVEGASGTATGVFWSPNSIDPTNRTRSFARTGHYDNVGGAATRSNFHLLPGNRVLQVLLDQSTYENVWEATGVIVVPRDEPLPAKPLQINARKEIILSAGTIHTPQILQRSGIGPRDTLEAAGVTVKVELPGVGYNLQDHAWYTITFDHLIPVMPNATTLTTDESYQAEALALWNANKTGPYTANTNSGAWLPLTVISERADSIVASILAQDPAAYLPQTADTTVIAGFAQQVLTRVRQLRSRGSAVVETLFDGSPAAEPFFLKPFSRGTVLIAPDDDGVNITTRGDKEPILDFRTFSNPVDLELSVEYIHYARKFYGSEAMQKALAPQWVSPPLNATDAELETMIRSTTSSSAGHLIGTAALAPRELGGVVGPNLTVYGTSRLSVADNSIIVLIPGTHTCSTAYAIGEKAADLILRRARQG